MYDDCNNFDTDTVTVTVIAPYANAGDDVAICLGNDTTLTATGGVSFEWSTGETSQTITVAPTQDECYWVDVTDDCGNTARDTVCVEVNDDVQANAGIDQRICIGDSITLTGEGGSLYIWDTAILRNQ